MYFLRNIVFMECICAGVQQYNEGTGYGDSFQWKGPHVDTTVSDCFGRRLCQLVAIDALSFGRARSKQYQETAILRELNKVTSPLLLC